MRLQFPYKNIEVVEKMLKQEFHHDYYANASLLEAKQRLPLPEHFKCGEVYTWLCAEELYAVECKLCEDHPLCPLSEFPEHMDVWHTNWEAAIEKHEENNINLQQSTVCSKENLDDENNESDLIESGDQLQEENNNNNNKKSKEIFEPFEQVLIEQDYAVESPQVGEHVNEEEYFKYVNEQVADAKHSQNKNKQQQKLHLNINQTLNSTTDKQRLVAKQITEMERELQYLKELQENVKIINVNNSKWLQSKANCSKFNIEPENKEKPLKKFKNRKEKFKNIKEINKKNVQETSGIETSDEEYLETKNMKQHLRKIKQIKKTLKIIVEAIGDLNELEETIVSVTDETGNDFQNIMELKPMRTPISESIKKSINSKHNLRNNWKKVGRTFENEICENEAETSENETHKLKQKIQKTGSHNKMNTKNKTVFEKFVQSQANIGTACYETIETNLDGNLKESKNEKNQMETTKTELVNSEDLTKSQNKSKSKKFQRETYGLGTVRNKNDKRINELKINTATAKTENSLNKKENNLINFTKCRKSKRIAKRKLKMFGDLQKNSTETAENKQSGIKETKLEAGFQTNENNSKYEPNRNTVLRNLGAPGENETKLNKNDKKLGEIAKNEAKENAIEQSENVAVLTNDNINRSGNETDRLCSLKIKPSKNRITTQKERVNQSINEAIRLNKNVVQWNDIEREHKENNPETNYKIKKIKANVNLNEIFRVNEKETKENETTDDQHFNKCLLKSFNARIKADYVIRKKMKFRKKLKGHVKHLKSLSRSNECQTVLKENDATYSKTKITIIGNEKEQSENEKEQREIEKEQRENETRTFQNAEKLETYLATKEYGMPHQKNYAENQKFLNERTIETCNDEKELKDNESYNTKYNGFYLKSMKLKKGAETKCKDKIRKHGNLMEIERQLNLLTAGNKIELSEIETELELDRIGTLPDKIKSQFNFNKNEIKLEKGNKLQDCYIKPETSEQETLNKKLGNSVNLSCSKYSQPRKTIKENVTKQNDNKIEESETDVIGNEKPVKEYILNLENEKHKKKVKEDPNNNNAGTNKAIKRNKAQVGFRKSRKLLHKNKPQFKSNENLTKTENNKESDKETSGNEISDAKFIKCLLKSYNLRNKAEKILNKKRNATENKKYLNTATEQSGSETKNAKNKASSFKLNLKDDNSLMFSESLEHSPLHFKEPIQSLRTLSESEERFQNPQEVSQSEIELQAMTPKETFYCRNFNGSQREFQKNLISLTEEKQEETEQQQESNERNVAEMEHLKKCKSLKLKDKIKSRWPKRKTIKREFNEEKLQPTQLLEATLRRKLKNLKSSSKSFKQVYLRKESRKRKTDQRSLKRNMFSGKRTQRTSSCETTQETFASSYPENLSTEFSESTESLQELSDPFFTENKRRREGYCQAIEKDKEKCNSWRNCKTPMKACVTEKATQKEDNENNTKQTLLTQFFGIKSLEERRIPKSPRNHQNQKVISNNCLTSSDGVSPKHFDMQDILNNTSTSLISDAPKIPEMQKYASIKDSYEKLSTASLSPLSPKTEEEDFEFYEPQKEQLNKQHISHLIKLYQEHPHLWDQSHPNFCEPQVCRISWQTITEQWNKFCKRNFTIAEIRIRICTLCQRFVQERERLALEGELDEFAKFPYYEQMKFLEQQKTLQKRRELYEQQNEQILEIYENFPILWNVGCYKLRQAKERAQAFDSIHKALKVSGINLSIFEVQKRIRSLRKRYRLEKIRYLHAQVEQTPYDSEFRHFERMHFLDKHIDPFVCRICDKIFENLQGFREHLELENHGTVLPDESDDEIDLDIEKSENENSRANQVFNINALSPISNHRDSFLEVENPEDILQRFTPLSCSPNSSYNAASNLELVASSPYIHQQDLNFSFNAANDAVINSLDLENKLIEEIMESVTNNDSLSQPGLDLFISSVTNCEELATDNCLSQEIFDMNLLPSQKSFVVEQSNIVDDHTLGNFTPISNKEIEPNSYSFVVEHPDVVTDGIVNVLDPETFIPEAGSSFILEYSESSTDIAVAKEIDDTLPEPTFKEASPFKELRIDNFLQGNTAEPSLTTAQVVKVHCGDYAIDANLKPESLIGENLSPSEYDSDKEFYSSADISSIPLPDYLIHKMIELYRKYPQLWNPNHLDFNSRSLRRQAWCSLTTKFNVAVGKQLSWRTLYRKLTDYAKYYKKLITGQKNYDHKIENKWVFYEDFKFMDDVIAVQDELQRSVHHRDNNFKIIAIYETFPQLWDIKHPDYNKRSTKQRNIEIMCNRLQEEHNLQLTTERLRNRLIELRTQYRVAKKQRLKCLQNQQQFSSKDFEFYEALHFLDDHIDPFVCDRCQMEFKKRTAYNQHLKKEHSPKLAHAKLSLAILPNEPGVENICHICAIKFSTRSNLLNHIRRHEGIRNYECTWCPKTFYASYALKVHIRSHTKECPYTCEKCGLSFVSASKLNQHFKRHLNRKDFKCDFCPKAFFTAYEKDRHRKRHLNIRDKVCPICGKTFVAGSSYYAHLMLHSDTKRFQCDKCDMKFTQYPGLYKHKKRHHT